MGIDESEFTAPTGNGRIHVYQFQGNTVGPPTPPGAQRVFQPPPPAPPPPPPRID